MMGVHVSRLGSAESRCISRFLRAEAQRATAESENDWELSAAMELHDVRARYLADERRRAQRALLVDLHLKPERYG